MAHAPCPACADLEVAVRVAAGNTCHSWSHGSTSLAHVLLCPRRAGFNRHEKLCELDGESISRCEPLRLLRRDKIDLSYHNLMQYLQESSNETSTNELMNVQMCDQIMCGFVECVQRSIEQGRRYAVKTSTRESA